MATRLLFFGALRDAAGGGERLVDLPAEIKTGVALIEWLTADDEMLRPALTRAGVRLCIDQMIAPKDAPIGAAGEIAFLPPYSGG